MSYETDKTVHKLIPEYERLFSQIKDKPLKILEIGIYRGGSLLWMLEYFPNASIIGVDLVIPDMKRDGRITLLKGDQNDGPGLQALGREAGPFDLIIDDGCHYARETQNTFDNLWQYVSKGGYYVIEDFIAGYWPDHRFTGMPDVVSDIMLNKKNLGISDYEIILKEPKCSIACFRKE